MRRMRAMQTMRRATGVQALNPSRRGTGLRRVCARMGLLIGLCMALAVQAPQALAQVRLQDDKGSSVTLAQPPQRIVSLLPALTESVCALGACQRLVGVDRYSNHPAEVQRLPRVGGGMDPALEAIVRLKPDLVLVATSTPQLARLRQLGLAVLALEPQTLDEVPRMLATLDRALGTEASAALWQRTQKAMQARMAAERARSTSAPKVYFEVSDTPHAAGPKSYVGQLIRQLGWLNVVPETLGVYPALHGEFIARADPDWILIGDVGVRDGHKRPLWSQLRAVRQGRVCAFSEAQVDVLVRAGPRVVEALDALLQCAERLRGPHGAH